MINYKSNTCIWICIKSKIYMFRYEMSRLWHEQTLSTSGSAGPGVAHSRINRIEIGS